jgi:hypothetical protein
MTGFLSAQEPERIVLCSIVAGETENRQQKRIIFETLKTSQMFAGPTSLQETGELSACHRYPRYSEGVTMRVPMYVLSVNKSLSPAISKSAFARAAHSRNISS